VRCAVVEPYVVLFISMRGVGEHILGWGSFLISLDQLRLLVVCISVHVRYVGRGAFGITISQVALNE
jgi:hypothetical protein